MTHRILKGAALGGAIGMAAVAGGVGYGVLLAYIGNAFGMLGVLAMSAILLGACFGGAVAADKAHKEGLE